MLLFCCTLLLSNWNSKSLDDMELYLLDFCMDKRSWRKCFSMSNEEFEASLILSMSCDRGDGEKSLLRE